MSCVFALREAISSSVILCAPGASVIRTHALSIAQKDGYAEILLDGGETVSASRVLVAAGGFTNQPGLLPDVLDMQVYGRTVCLFEVSEEEAFRLASMPSLIFEDEPEELGVYLLPPILYPDGKHYLKIGGRWCDHLLWAITAEDFRGRLAPR